MTREPSYIDALLSVIADADGQSWRVVGQPDVVDRNNPASDYAIATSDGSESALVEQKELWWGAGVLKWSKGFTDIVDAAARRVQGTLLELSC